MDWKSEQTDQAYIIVHTKRYLQGPLASFGSLLPSTASTLKALLSSSKALRHFLRQSKTQHGQNLL
jgi:hypothetical protein